MRDVYRMMASCAAALCAALLAAPGRAQGVTFEEVRTLSRGPVPVVRTFDVTATGTYRLTLTDLVVPTEFDSLQAAITRGDVVVASLSAPGSVDVNITAPGSYALRVVGIPDPVQWHQGRLLREPRRLLDHVRARDRPLDRHARSLSGGVRRRVGGGRHRSRVVHVG